jgi:hypothetical protein
MCILTARVLFGDTAERMSLAQKYNVDAIV